MPLLTVDGDRLLGLLRTRTWAGITEHDLPEGVGLRQVEVHMLARGIETEHCDRVGVDETVPALRLPDVVERERRERAKTSVVIAGICLACQLRPAVAGAPCPKCLDGHVVLERVLIGGPVIHRYKPTSREAA